MPAKLLHACVGASDLERSEAFYGALLGLEVRDRYSQDGWTVSFLGTAQSQMELELVTWEGRTAIGYQPPGQDVHVCAVVEDVEAEHARMGAIASRIEPIMEHRVGGRAFARYFFVADPDGNWIEIVGRNERYR